MYFGDEKKSEKSFGNTLSFHRENGKL